MFSLCQRKLRTKRILDSTTNIEDSNVLDIIIDYLVFDEIICCGDESGFVNIFNTDNSQHLKQKKYHNSAIKALAILPDGSLAVGGQNGILAVYDLETDECLIQLGEHTGTISSLVLTQDKKFLCSGSYDHTIIIWRIEDWAFIRLSQHENVVSCLLILPDGSLCSGSYDNTIKIWDTQNWNCTHTLIGHNNRVLSLCCNDDYLYSVDYSNYLLVWDLNTKISISSINFDSPVKSILSLPNNLICCGFANGNLELWNGRISFLIQSLESSEIISCGNLNVIIKIFKNAIVSGNEDVLNVFEFDDETNLYQWPRTIQLTDMFEQIMHPRNLVLSLITI